MLNRLVAFILGERHYALSLSSVSRVVRMVEVTPLPKAPEVVLGVIDVQGNIIPVFNMRKRFGMAESEADLTGQLILAEAGARNVALLVDSVTEVVERTVEEVTEADNILPGVQYVEGFTTLEDGILLIHDLDRFLFRNEERQLDGLLAQAAGTE